MRLATIDIQQLGKRPKKYTAFFADLHMGGLSVAHNGNLTNALLLRDSLVKDGAIFRTTSDTETIVQLIAKSKEKNLLRN